MTTATAQQRERSADDAFLSLLCADPEWVRAEFDALIEAEWDTAVPGRAEGRREWRAPRHKAAPPTRPVAFPEAGERAARGRQRSPPVTADIRPS